FSGDLCKLFVACSFLWLAVGNPQMHLFTDKWMPGMAIPDRRVLSGRVLDSEVARVEMQLADKVNGKLGTGQCDGWKNVAKTNVITSMMTVENEPYLVCTHNVQGEPKTGDKLLELVVSDIQFILQKFRVSIIAWCTDDGPDGKKARRLLREKFSSMVVSVCWAHQ
ncbi:hypothetical protein FIBSPDRAFT_692517, partial [Athelia psychrophila]